MTPIEDLPVSWQNTIRELRAENARLRIRSREQRIENTGPSIDGLSPSWAKKLRDYRRENAKFRTERNEARRELAELRAELEARGK